MTPTKSDLIQCRRRGKWIPSKQVCRNRRNPDRPDKDQARRRRGCPDQRVREVLRQEKAGEAGRNPATGEDMMLEARRVVTFKCSGQLRDKINKTQ